MKKFIFVTALLGSSVYAAEIELNNVVFRSGEFGIEPIIELSISNNTQNEVVAFKAGLTCLDAFGDVAFTLNITDRSANIPPRARVTGAWKPNMFSDAGKIVLSNDAKNFSCSFEDIQVVLK